MKKHFSHLQIIALGFFLLITFGTLLLMLPAASLEKPATFTEALFTSTSASCVTGLVVRDTSTSWSIFGKTVILILIQAGGLGFMTIALGFSMLLHRKIGLRHRQIMTESIGAFQIGGIVRFTRIMLGITFFTELSGAVLLSFRFIPQFGVVRGIFYSIFHSVSAFCNAGFDLMGSHFGEYSSFTAYGNDVFTLTVIMLLITVGGLGFTVISDILKNRMNFRKYSLHSKIVISTSAVLLFGGALLFYIFEYSSESVNNSVLSAFFSSVTARTAGFNSVDTAGLSDSSKLLTMILMLIGGSPGSTAGGIKTTTFAILLLYAFSNIRGKKSVSLFSRSISSDSVKKASTVFFINISLALGGALAICAMQSIPLTDVLFEVFSAIGTVGMSTGITCNLNTASRLIIIVLMYCGRVGSISFALALMEKHEPAHIENPEENIMIG